MFEIPQLITFMAIYLTWHCQVTRYLGMPRRAQSVSLKMKGERVDS